MTARERLASVTGNSQVRGSAAGGDIESVPSLQPLSVLVSQLNDSPGSRVARAEMLRSDAAISVERAKRIPDITVSAGMKRVITGGVSDNQAVIGVSIPLPLSTPTKALCWRLHIKPRKPVPISITNACGCNWN